MQDRHPASDGGEIKCSRFRYFVLSRVLSYGTRKRNFHKRRTLRSAKRNCENALLQQYPMLGRVDARSDLLAINESMAR